MAIAFVQRKSNGAANAGPVTVTLTSAATAGNLLLAFHVDGDTTDNAMPAVSGFTDVGSSEQYTNATNDCNSKAWYKYAAGGETSITFPDTGGGTNDGVSACVMEFSGVAAAADGGPFSTAAVLNSGSGSAHADPAQIATATDDCVVIMGGAAHATTGVTFTAPANYTTNAEGGTAGTDTISSGAGMAYRLSGYANPENPGAFTASATAAGDSWHAVTLALKAAPVATQLTVQNAAVAVSIDSPALTQHNVLVVQNSAVAVTAENAALTQHNILAVQNAAVAVTADNVTLTIPGTPLTVQDAAVGVTIDNVAISTSGGETDYMEDDIYRRRLTESRRARYNRAYHHPHR